MSGGQAYPPTARQLALLRYIAGYQAAKGYCPSFREMAAGIGVGSTSTVSYLLDDLEADGAIDWPFARTRGIEVLVSVPVPRAPDGAPLYFVGVR